MVLGSSPVAVTEVKIKLFKLAVEITLVIGRISTQCIPSSFYCLILIRCIVFIASAKISEREGSISPSSFYGQLADF